MDTTVEALSAKDSRVTLAVIWHARCDRCDFVSVPESFNQADGKAIIHCRETGHRVTIDVHPLCFTEHRTLIQEVYPEVQAQQGVNA